MVVEAAPPGAATHADAQHAFRKLVLAFLVRNLDDLAIPRFRAAALHWFEVELTDPESVWHGWLFHDLGLTQYQLDLKIKAQLHLKGRKRRSVLPWSMKSNQGDNE